MSRIRGKDTTPERIVRSLLRRLGYRFRLHVRIPIGRKKAQKAQKNSPSASTGKMLPSPHPMGRGAGGEVVRSRIPRAVSVDVLLSKYRVAIFVHGCFWHRHRGCKNCTTPTHQRAWWLKKLNGNAARDKLHQRALRKLRWRPIVIWECQAEKPKTLDRLGKKFSKLIG